MNRLEIFKQVKEHMLTQNAKALDEGGECVYLSDTGLKCAVGCLIKPEYYDEKIEGLAVEGLYGFTDQLGRQKAYKYEPLRKAIENSLGCVLDHKKIAMLDTLQQIHDCGDVSNWENELNQLEQEIIDDE